MKNLLSIIFLAAIGVAMASWLPLRGDWTDKVDPRLIALTEAGGTAEMLVLLQPRANLQPAAAYKRKEEKGRFVYEQLRITARKSQAGLLSMLQQAGAPRRSFIIVNAVWTRGGRRLLRHIANRGEVVAVQYNPPLTFHRPAAEAADIRLREEVEWGIARIKADRVWELGIRGQGAVVAGGDTGYDWTHPALSAQYRGVGSDTVIHDYSWYDAIHEISPVHGDTAISPDLNSCGLDVRMPCDDNGHGTHTMGTMIGDAGPGNQIGVAPGAQWIACRNMERGYGSPATYLECFEFFLAPTDLDGQRPDPAMAPHVINNSWGCPPMEGCTPENFSTLDKAVQALRAAGVVVVASAGNAGNKCGTIDDPAAIYDDAFTIGATRPNDSIAAFSSRGPVTVDGSLRAKPDVVAPGVGVRSALPGERYASFSGTSMAGPHVAGVVALMISANPNLAGQVDRIEAILRETAIPMQDTVACNAQALDALPNYTYGYGRIDAFLAVQRALELTDLDAPPANARITAFPNPASDRVWLRLDGLRGAVLIEVYDIAGRRVHREVGQIPPGGEQEVLLPSLPAGTYWYAVETEAGKLWGKLIVI